MSHFTPMQWVIAAVIFAVILYGAWGFWGWLIELRKRLKRER